METVLLIITPLLGAAVGSLATFLVQERKFRREFRLDREKVRTEFMAEQVAKQLLEAEEWKQRSLDAIKRRLGGFEEKELQKLLVRAGAIRFDKKGGGELWGLLSRNRDAL